MPRHFAERLGAVSSCRAMPNLWDVVAAMGIDDFIGHRNRFVAEHGEPKRAGDLKYHRESYSPLHSVNPNMLPMTYHGIRLLHLWHLQRPSPLARPASGAWQPSSRDRHTVGVDARRVP